MLPSSQEYHLGDLVDYSCPDPEFSLLGPSRRVCSGEGVWRPELPSCGEWRDYHYQLSAQKYLIISVHCGPLWSTVVHRGHKTYKHFLTMLLLSYYMDLQCVGSSSSLSSSGISFSPTMLSITRSRGPPPAAPPRFLLRLRGAETTASSAERCFLVPGQYLPHNTGFTSFNSHIFINSRKTFGDFLVILAGIFK